MSKINEEAKKIKSKGKGFFKEFKEFITKGNALALAIGVIIGSCFTSIVNSVNNDILMPVIGAIVGKFDFKAWRTPLWNAEKVIVDGVQQYDAYGQELYTSAIYWGNFIQTVLNFLLTALVLFIILKVAKKVERDIEAAKKKLLKEEEAAPAEESAPAPEPVKSDETLLLEEIRDLLKEKK